MAEEEKKSSKAGTLEFADKASQAMHRRAQEENISTVWERYNEHHPSCRFGELGICCRVCSMGPCRLDPKKKKRTVGICGADYDTIAARNLARMIAAGTAAHSDHGRDIAHTLLKVAKDPDSDYSIKDPERLKAVAEIYDIKTEGKEIKELAGEVAEAVLKEFGQQEGLVKMGKLAPEKRQQLWKELGIHPRAIDREVVEIMHRTTMGVDADYKNIMKQGMRAALGDGWGGSMIATHLSDVLFGSPDPLRSEANLGVLKEDNVNIIVHGHDPTLSDMVAIVVQDEKLIAKAKEKGAQGITLAGLCCTANEILMRHGVPLAGTNLQQELAILTGAVDLMMVDVQCIMPGLGSLSRCFHTKLVTTSPKAKWTDVEHVEFHEDKAVETATRLIEMAIDNFPNRKKEKVNIPDEKKPIIAGFTTENTFHFLGGKYRSTYRPLNDAIIQGRLRGAAGVIGCSNPNVPFEEGHIKLVKELLINDVLVVTTGCNASACAKHGLLQPESAFEFAGKGIQEVCQAVGIPPVLHLGSCVDNSRILTVLSNIVAEGGLGDDISELPAAGAAPEWMSEKAIAIGFYFVASGAYTMIAKPLPMMGSENLHKYLTEEVEAETGGKWAFEEDPIEAAHKMIREIDKKRALLKLKPVMYEVPFKQVA
jgi:carbon-monoxide dehydrogenase catalytic subunit